MTVQTKELVAYCVRYTAKSLVRLLDQRRQQPSPNQREFLRSCRQLLKKLEGK